MGRFPAGRRARGPAREAHPTVERRRHAGACGSKLEVDLGHRASLVDNAAGILGGIKLWEVDTI